MTKRAPNIASLALAMLLGAAASCAAGAPPPASAFFSQPELSAAQLSPSGRYLATRLANAHGRQRLAVLDLAAGTAHSVANLSEVDVGNFSWVNDERLLFDTKDGQQAAGDQRYAPGLYAVNRDGGQFRQLAFRGERLSIEVARMQPWHTYMLRQAGAQDSDSAYVVSAEFGDDERFQYYDLVRLNTQNGYAEKLASPGAVQTWLLDSKGEPRIATTAEQGHTSVRYLDPQTKAWRLLATFGRFVSGEEGFEPLAVGPDGTLYVVRHGPGDKAAVYKYDLAAGKAAVKPMLEVDGFDFSGQMIFGRDKLLGVRYLSDAQGTRWFDPAMQAVQNEIDARLPGMVNLVTPPSRPETPHLLVESYSDVQPRVFLLYNSATKALSQVGAAHPHIAPAQMGRRELVRYAARDGLSIPAWVTLPPGGGKQLPLVVLVHGGPYRRGGEWGWQADAQFLASRGYAVLEPEFRGSTGFGAAHFAAGWKQWGLKMQDDIADGVRWTIAQGVADGSRVCIAGASYGGYSALMGLVNDSALYRCGVAWAAVTDIGLMYSGHWRHFSDMSSAWKQYGMPQLVGDPELDAAQFAATSPLRQAARITQPLLLAHGGADLRVPLIHGTRLRDAVRAHNQQLEWIEYEKEGHGWALPKNSIDFWERVEQFLDRNIGAGAAKTP
jgi:dipeptidyl aminopeptidase/acylaminoacyl peptidase